MKSMWNANRNYNKSVLELLSGMEEARACICSRSWAWYIEGKAWMLTPGRPVAVRHMGKSYADVFTDDLGDTRLVSTAYPRTQKIGRANSCLGR